MSVQILPRDEAVALLREHLKRRAPRPGLRQLCIHDVNLLTPEQLCVAVEHVLCEQLAVQRRLQKPETPWEHRRVDAVLRITYQGWHWSVADLPGVHVGDLVQCRPTRRGAFLRVRADREAPSSILASRLEPAHSHRHTSPPVGIEVSSGTGTTSRAHEPRSSSPDAHAPHTPQRPPTARPEAHTHSRSAGTAGAVPAVCSISIELAAVPAQGQSPRPRKKGRNRQRVALRISISGC